MGVLTFAITPKDTEVLASTNCRVTFNYNISAIEKYLPKDESLRNSLSTYYVDIPAGSVVEETRKPLSSLSTYYTYEWYTSSGEKVNLSQYRVYNNIVLHAKWTPVEYTIYYNYRTTEEMTEISNLMHSQTYNIETPRLYLYKPTRQHYVFMGWYRTNEIKEYIYVESGSIGDFVVYAKWRPFEYLINYNTDAENSRNPVSYSIEDGDYVLASPSKAGHIFKGWYLDEEFTTPISTIPAGSTGNINVYPKWELERYRVTYVLPDKSKQTLEVEYGKSAPLPNIEKSIFEIVVTSVSRNNITDDTTIELKLVNIWYVYVIGILLIVGLITLIIVLKKRRDRILSRLRYMYQSNSNKKY